jgi:ribosomal protein S18 acetylase RimI-like enzyme
MRTMKVTRTLCRLYVEDLERALSLQEQLQQTKAAMRCALPGTAVDLAQVGNVLLIAGPTQALMPFRETQATFLVDSLDECRAFLEGNGAVILGGSRDVPVGRKMIVRHPDGSVIEYAEFVGPHAGTDGTTGESHEPDPEVTGGTTATPVIRRAGRDDAAAITAHNIAMARETEGRVLAPDRARRGVEAVLGDAGRGFYLLAESGGRVVGQCMVTYEWSDWRCGDFWWIQSVYVDREYRRSGVFSRLYRALVQDACSRGDVVGIRLYVDRDNRDAQDVYRSLGMPEAHYTLFDLEFTTTDRV